MTIVSVEQAETVLENFASIEPQRLSGRVVPDIIENHAEQLAEALAWALEELKEAQDIYGDSEDDDLRIDKFD